MSGFNKRADNMLTPADVAESLGMLREDWDDEIPGSPAETIGQIIDEMEQRGVDLELLAVALYAQLLGRGRHE